MKTFEERFDALPKWAKDHIKGLNKDIKDLTEALAIEREYDTGSGRIKLLKNESVGQVTLPDDISIEFDLPERSSCMHMNWFEDQQYGQHVRIYASGSLQVLPMAANSVYLIGD